MSRPEAVATAIITVLGGFLSGLMFELSHNPELPYVPLVATSGVTLGLSVIGAVKMLVAAEEKPC